MQFKGPLQLAAGDADGHCPAADLKLLAEKVGGLAQVRIVQRADHFFGGRETELTAAIGEMSATDLIANAANSALMVRGLDRR